MCRRRATPDRTAARIPVKQHARRPFHQPSRARAIMGSTPRITGASERAAPTSQTRAAWVPIQLVRRVDNKIGRRRHPRLQLN
jgi:hypothetical protein